MRRHRTEARWTAAILAGCAALAAAAAPAANPEFLTRVPGNQGADGESVLPAVTSSGRFVAFQSAATNLVDGDGNGADDVFVRDRKAGTTERVSLDADGNEVAGYSRVPSLSANGRFVLFQYNSGDLVPDDFNGEWDVFLKDRRTGAVTRVSVDEAGNEAAGGATTTGLALSANGRYAVFESSDPDLVADDGDGYSDIFLRDTKTGRLTLVSRNGQGIPANNHSYNPTISANGRFVAYDSVATDLPGDPSGNRDVYIFDRKTGLTRKGSVDLEGGPANWDSFEPVVSSNGQVVAFYSLASDLVGGDGNSTYDVFVHDYKTGTNRRVSVTAEGGEVPGASYTPSLAANGKVVLFYAEADGLVPEDQNGRGDVYSVVLATGALRLLSATAQGEVGDGYSWIGPGSLASSGKWAAFSSLSTNLANQDRNGSVEDIFFVPAQ